MAAGGGRRGVVTGGTWCCDHNKVVDRWPAEDAIAEIEMEERHGGGSACNLALDLKKLDPDFPVETIGVVGDDDDGRLLLAEADAAGIERSQLVVDGSAPTNYTDAFSSRLSGRRTHIFNQGTSGVLTPDHFDFSRTSGRLLHLGLPGVHRKMDAPWNGDENGWVAVLRKARQAGLETNLELASVGSETIARLVRPCLPHLDFLIVNDVEIGAIAGKATGAEGETDVAAAIEAATAVFERGSMKLVVVHYPTGAIAIDRGGLPMVRPSVRVPQSEIVGANGAGDAFAAGAIYGLHEGWPLTEAIALAHAAAAASLRSVGTTGTVESWRACLDLATRWGWRESV